MKVFNAATKIWSNMDASYETLKKSDETKTEFLGRITGYYTSNKLPLIASKIESEMQSNKDILVEGRQLVTIITLVSNNLENLMKKDIQSLNNEIANLLEKKIVKEPELSGFGIQEVGPILLDPLQLLYRHGSISFTTSGVGANITSYDSLPLPLQASIAIPNEGSVLYLKQHVESLEIPQPFVDKIYDVIRTEFRGVPVPLIFVPRNLYRKTPSGFNLDVDGTTMSIPAGKVRNKYILVRLESGIHVILIPIKYGISN